jgi:hypothetical protein
MRWRAADLARNTELAPNTNSPRPQTEGLWEASVVSAGPGGRGHRQFLDHRQRRVGFEPGDDAALCAVEVEYIARSGSIGIDLAKLARVISLTLAAVTTA